MGKIIGNIPFTGTVGGITVTKNGVVKEASKHRTPSRSRDAIRQKCLMRGMMAIFPMLKEHLMGTLEDCPNPGVASNKFVNLNRHRTPVWIPKKLKQCGASFVVDYAVSQGTLYRIEQHLTAEKILCTDIVLASDITADTTVGQLSADILEHNGHFAEGDTLKLFSVKQRLLFNPPMPQACCHVMDLRLDRFDTALLSEAIKGFAWCRCEGHLALAEPLSNAAATFIHVRVEPDGRLYASTQELLCVNPVAEPYTTEEAFDDACLSYGGSDE